MDFLFDRFATAADRAALIHDDRGWTYDVLLERIAARRRELVERGIGAGAVVALAGEYTPETVAWVFALLAERCVLVPISPDSVVEQSVMLDLAEAGWLLTIPPGGEGEPTWTRFETVPVRPMLVDFMASGHPGLILFSSGSTGKPKAMLLDVERVLAKFRQPRQALNTIAFLTLDHFGGINTLLAILSSLGTLVTVTRRTLASVCGAIEKHAVQVLPATPSFLTMLVQSDAGRRFDLSSLTLITYGTEVMPQAVLDQLREQFPAVKLQQTYGLSELGVLRSRSRDDGSLWVKVGGEGFETKVVDGILWIRSEYAMIGYLNAPSPFDAEGWFDTQDRVEVDGEWLRILGRVTDIINVGGQKVYPAEVEDVILRLDNIADVSVRGEAAPLIGTMVVAHVELREPEATAALRTRIRRACAAELAAYKVPTKVVIAEGGLYSSRMKKIRGTAGVTAKAAAKKEDA